MPTLDDVRRVASQLPGSEERPSGGGLAWFVRRKPFAWESMPWPSEPEHVRVIVAAERCLGVRVADEDEKRALAQGWPDGILAWDGRWMEPKVVVRLGAIDLDHLAELVTESWRTQAPKYLVREFEQRR
jgi:hypothetical protein